VNGAMERCTNGQYEEAFPEDGAQLAVIDARHRCTGRTGGDTWRTHGIHVHPTASASP
jgi:hypothetical protein